MSPRLRASEKGAARSTVPELAGALPAAAIFIQSGFGAFTLWHNRVHLDNN